MAKKRPLGAQPEFLGFQELWGTRSNYSRDKTGRRCSGKCEKEILRPSPTPRVGSTPQCPSKWQIHPEKNPVAIGREQLLLSVPSGLVTTASYPLPPQPDLLTSNTASAKAAQLGSPTNASRKAVLWGLLESRASSPPPKDLVKANARPIKSKGPHSQQRNSWA